MWRTSSHAPTAMTIIGHPCPIQSKRRKPSVLNRKSMPTIISTMAPIGSGRRPNGPQQAGSGGTGGTGGTGSYHGGGGTGGPVGGTEGGTVGGTGPAAGAAPATGGHGRFGMPIFCPSSFSPKGS